MNEKKILFLIVILYFVVLGTVYFIDRNSISGYIVLSDYGCLKCKNLNCAIISNEKISNLDKKDKMLDLYIEGENQGKYYGNYSQIWNMFTEEGKLVAMLPGFVGISSNFNGNLSLPEVRKTNDLERQEIDKILKDKKFNYDYKLVRDVVYDYDFNNDGELDSFYFLSNFDFDEGVKNKFTLFYTKINGKTNIVDYKYGDQSYENPVYYNLGFVNINNQNAILVRESYFDATGDSKVILYKEKSNKLSKVTSIANSDFDYDGKVKEGTVFNFNNEFLKKMVKVGSIVGIIVLVLGGVVLFFKNKSNSSNEI